MLTHHIFSRFRWVFCQLETLRQLVNRDLRGTLEKLPKTLDETYEQILKDINEGNREHARRLLHCLAVAIRPLRVEEFAEILAFDFDGAKGNIPKFRAEWRSTDQEEAVLRTCSSLITVIDNRDFRGDVVSRVVQFSHFSVKEFLVSDRLASPAREVSRYHILPGLAHTILVQTCLGYLLHLDTPTDWDDTVKRFPLARYAAQHWVAHAQFEDVASHVGDGMRSLFDPDKHHLEAWLLIYDIDTYKGRAPLDGPPNHLCYAALCGFHDVVEHLIITHPQLINSFGGWRDIPLFAALSNNHIRAAELLVQHGAKVDIRGKNGLTLLQMLLDKDEDVFEREDIVVMGSFLVRHGADPNVRRSDLSTPLHDAVMYGIVELVLLLLEKGANVDSRNDKGRTPLHFVSWDEESEEAQGRSTTQLLLERGANVNAQDKDGATPVLVAAHHDDSRLAEVLLEHGAEINAKNNDCQTALHRGVGSPSLARLLLRHGANVNDEGKDHETPLHLATRWQSFETAQILLEHDAKPNVVNKDGKTPLHLVLEHKEHDLLESAEIHAPRLVRLLLERGANVNAQDKDNTTPFLLAMKWWSCEMAQILLEHDAQPNVVDKNGKTPLHFVLEAEVYYPAIGEVDAAIPARGRLLLELGANVNAHDKDNTTPLHLAMKWGSREMVQILLEHDAQPNVVDKDGKPPLHLVLELVPYYRQVEQTHAAWPWSLPAHVADVFAQYKDSTTPMHLVFERKIYDITRMLLACGAEPNVKDYCGRTPLHLLLTSFSSNHDSISDLACLLLDYGADVNARGQYHATPLLLAIERHMNDIARILLERGADPNVKNTRGKTPLHLLLERYFHDYEDINSVLIVERLLLERGADVNAQDEDNITPLYLAYRQRRFEIALVIIDSTNTEKDVHLAQSYITLEGEYSSQEKVLISYGFH